MKPFSKKEHGRIVAALDRVDWNFPRAGTWAGALHSLHWFPGNFIPQIPSDLIQLLSVEGDVVFDPFCGSCTTGVEAIALKRNAWMSDFSPVRHLISRAKLALLTDETTRRELSSIELPPLLMISPGFPYAEQNERFMREWFHPDTLDQLSRLWNFIGRQVECRSRDVLQMLFSDTLFACASTLGSRTASGKVRRHHWGWVADNVRPKPPIWHDAFKYFDERLHRAKQIVSRLGLHEASADIRREDVRSCSYSSSTADLVVTSPPYLGMIDYTKASRLTYLWNGWDLAADGALEIGARSRRDSLSAGSKYLLDIEAAASQIRRVLKPGGFCAIVIGASRKYPDMAFNVVDIFTREMDLIWGPTTRIPTRRRVSDRKGTAPSEAICLLRKN